MAYVKNTWVDREGTTRYHETIDDDGALIFTPDYEKVTEMGTPVNADNMNHIEDGIEDHENRITVLENTEGENFVKKAGDTMTGNLTIQTTYGGHLQGVKTGIKLGDTPASQANIGGFRCYAGSVAESNMTAIVQGFIKTASNQSSTGIQFITRKPDNSGWGTGMTLETLANGITYFTFPRCTAKATTTSTANAGNVAVITQNYKNGTSWYRVWSDGWIEQGGYNAGHSSYTSTVTLLKSFSDTNYTVLITGTENARVTYGYNFYNTKTKTSFKAIAAEGYDWYACGY